ncbi:hypothetical protein ACF0H5_011936 [Mactra antiquata]
MCLCIQTIVNFNPLVSFTAENDAPIEVINIIEESLQDITYNTVIETDEIESVADVSQDISNESEEVPAEDHSVEEEDFDTSYHEYDGENSESIPDFENGQAEHTESESLEPIPEVEQGQSEHIESESLEPIPEVEQGQSEHIESESLEPIPEVEQGQSEHIESESLEPIPEVEHGQSEHLESESLTTHDAVEDSGYTHELYGHIRLPQSIRPTFYDIWVFPHMYGPDPELFSYDCETIIHINCIENTSVVILHSVDNHVIDWNITDKPQGSKQGRLYYNYDKEMIEFYVGFTMVAGHKYILTIRTNSSLSNSLRGLYYSPYNDGNVTKYILTTMMEPTDARRVFPCFDEPDFKAVFIFEIKRKPEVTSVANLPKRLTIGPDEDGYYTDIFDQPQTVPMSTYLVAFAIGELGFLESSVNNITFRTISRKSAINQTRYALDIGMKFMEFFEDYFQIPYSLPKEDMIAVPTMSFSGMEHWGLITYRESAMLYEEGVSSLDDKEWITIITAHEIAHQWFGNLVSPYWWDDLWLNEGFATYMMYLAVDRVFPEWNMINKLIVDFRGVQNVMNTDDHILSHPVYVSVNDPVEITQIFDLISYAKGGSVIRMMNFFLGEDTFRKGLTRFLKTYTFKTATHLDLWKSLSEQAVIDNHKNSDVMAVMNNWILEENFPVVMVTKKDDVTLELTQSAFLRNAEQRSMRSNITWKIPFVYTTNLDGNFDQTYEDIHWLEGKTMTVTDQNLKDSTWIIGNVQQYGFYRVNYDVALWEAILDQLMTNHTVIHPINRAQIINDAWNLARAGMLDFKIALRTFDYLDSETDFVPWSAAIREIKNLKSSLLMSSVYGAFENFMRTRIKKAYLDSAGSTNHYKRIQYTLIANEACKYGLEDCIKDATETFEAWMADSNLRINPDLKESIYCTGVKYGGYRAWHVVLQRYKISQSTSEKRFLMNALTCTDKPWIFNKLADIVMETDTFLKTDGAIIIINMFKSSIGRLLKLPFLDKHWSTVLETYREDINLLTNIVEAITRTVSSELELKMVLEFLVEKEKSATRTKLIEGIYKMQAETNNNQLDAVEKWLRVNYDLDVSPS